MSWYAALWVYLTFMSTAGSANLADLKTSESYPIPSPTLLFIKPTHLTSLSSAILEEAKSSSFVIFSLAWRHKLSGILEGFITKQSLWDRIVFDGARVSVMGKGAGTIRGVVISGGMIGFAKSRQKTPSDGFHQ